MHIVDHRPGTVERPVLWTRGQGCQELAVALSVAEPVRVVGDITEACIRHRAELLVSRRLPGNLDLLSAAVPVEYDPKSVSTVVAAVAGGPHSELAVRVAERLGAALGVPASIASAYQDEAGKSRAVAVITELFERVPAVEYRLVEAQDAAELVSGLPDGALLVIGAPGGGWLQRLFFGAGAKLRQEAPAGAVIVRRAPNRVFQVMDDPVFVGPLREAVDILRVHEERVLAVVDRAHLVGLVRREALELAEPGVPVQVLMEGPLSIPLTAAVGEARPLLDKLAGCPVPVVDEEGRLVGSLAPEATTEGWTPMWDRGE
jgi:CBS domain-containing protein